MPNNVSKNNYQEQRQRSKAGARVFKSKKESEQEKLRRLEKQLAKASDLEDQLGALMSTNSKAQGDDNKPYRLRSHLCEVLSDVLISSPKLSLEKDCFQRLWRCCFYNPIRIWRQRVSREKRKRSPNLTTTQEGFKNFLSEAVTLYDFLILQYLSKLCPSSTQQDCSMTQQSKDTYTTYDRSQLEDTQYASQSTTAIIAEPAEQVEGVVHGLYKLYIFMGDLHRYAEAYNKAESNYLNASKLGPGLGNPYNQLAVVAFSKETYCVALYWYARSLLATHERFSTSSNNLERLFASNREFLREHGRNSGVPMVLSQASVASSHKGSGKNKNIKTNSSNNKNNSMLRAQKVAVSKSCLTHFVDLHYDLYLLKQQQSSKNTNLKVLDSNYHDQSRKNIRNVTASLKSLVQASGFSDSLLCKIVVINSFSLERAIDCPDTDALGGTVENLPLELGKELFYSLGLVLAEHTEGLLAKSLEKASMNKVAPSVRCLLPLEMMLDFCNLRLIQNGEKLHDDQKPAEIEFWKRVSQVANQVRNVLKGYQVVHGGTKDDSKGRIIGGSSTPHWTRIKEYQLLKGYRPFSIVNEEYLSNEDGLLDAIEAVDVLELTAPSQSQDTCAASTLSTSGGGGGGAQENVARLFRMIEVCDELASANSLAPLTSENGTYNYQQKNSSSSPGESLGDSDNNHINQEEIESQEENCGFVGDDDDDEAGDLIISTENRKETPTNGAPPQTMNRDGITIAPLSSTDVIEKPKPPLQPVEEPENGDDVVMAVVEEEKSSNPVIPSMLKPPPGFGVAPTQPAPNYSETTVNDKHMTAMTTNPTTNVTGFAYPPVASHGLDALDKVMQANATAATSSFLYQMPQQQQRSVEPVPSLMERSLYQNSPYPLETGRSNLPTSVEESTLIFGDMRTANPFAMEMPPSSFSVSSNNTRMTRNIHHGNPVSSIIPDFAAEVTNAPDDTKWLNSNLLNSLFMEDTSKTSNPWASK
ncbi:unnamed protein product [Pseudo-nitzschia multistriata]|uniref:Telomerase activating protein Est1-like N-terminal domain-containing protein n=1 Tax=Pseudo-nitzschia multistriata TaxID=183589 RepID=A0A448YYN8_9STRA|nr:unnamed protein product [Pseudo-nitzschia multistriata]